MDDIYKLIGLMVAFTALLVAIGITAVLGERRGRRKQRVKHQLRAGEAAAQSWAYQPINDSDFQLSGRSREGISWTLYARVADAENSTPGATLWSTNSVFAAEVQLYVSKRSMFKRMGTWLGGGVPAPLKSFCESAREVAVNTLASGDDYVVAALNESFAYQVFGQETQAAYLNWILTWASIKQWGNSFTIQLGGSNLKIELDQFIDSMAVLQQLIRLGEALAHSYQKISRKEPPRSSADPVEPLD